MTPFSALMLWMGLCWLVYRCKVEPLQPDKLEDNLGDVDVRSREFQVALKNASWWDEPQINVALSRRGRVR